jgi:cytochrome c-type biogenesis protein CcmF
MNTLIGQGALAFSVVVVAIAFFAALASIRFAAPALLRAARGALVGFAALLTLASASLMWALLHSDFSIAYVAEYTERALPIGYKVAAFWAGQSGSILLWAWLLAIMTLIVVVQQWKKMETEFAISTAVLAAICGFFAILLLFASNPFDAATDPQADGRGLNPMLQTLAMIAHPPTLFLGYAGFAIPFAFLMGALISGRTDSTWLARSRPWIIVSWLFLGVGILLGAQWAYMELGWGGYWAWDPVENASLLPWLTGTALLHCLIAQQRRGIFKRWTAAMVATTFILCIFGTYLTRSGVVQSVHAFGESIVGRFFLGFLAVLVIASVATILLRLKLLKAEHKIEQLLSREGLFLIGNILFVLMMVVTLVGTVFPLLSGPFLHEPLTVSGPFYNNLVLPMALAAAALMAAAPLINYGSNVLLRSTRSLKILGAAAVGGALLVGVLGFHNPWALASAAIAAAIVTGITLDFAGVVAARRANSHENIALAVVRVLNSDHHRWGGYMVHLGVGMIVVGIAGSSLYNANQTFQMEPGKSMQVGRAALHLDSIEQKRMVNYSAIQANVTLTEANGQTTVLQPQRRFYDKGMEPGQSASEVAIRFSLAGDVYVNLAGWDEGGKMVAIQVILNPLVNWIWIGGGLLALGAIFCLIPRLRAAQTAPAPVNAKAPRVKARVQAVV